MAEGGVPQLRDGDRFQERYLISKKLGEGGFGGVYLVLDNRSNQRHALKIEGANDPIQLLKMEVYVLETLVAKGASRHFASIIDKGRTATCNYIVMTLLGKSLQDLKKMSSKGCLSMSSSLRVALYCLEALEDLHGIGYLHRDVKPGNFAVGREDVGELRKVYCLDFGMCREYISKRTGQIRTPRQAAGFRGTVRYAPLNCHYSRELSRKDDCETWLYQTIELTSGKLPWANVNDPTEVGKLKERVRNDANVKELFGGCPREYIQLMKLIDDLRYYDAPPYQQIYTMLRATLTAQGGKESDLYDWEPGATTTPGAGGGAPAGGGGAGFQGANRPFF